MMLRQRLQIMVARTARAQTLARLGVPVERAASGHVPSSASHPSCLTFRSDLPMMDVPYNLAILGGWPVGDMRKATFVLPVALIVKMRRLVDLGLAESASALVRESLEDRVRQLREKELAREFEEAARDPLFLADQRDIEEAFSSVAADGMRVGE